jgi:hypothetical protein
MTFFLQLFKSKKMVFSMQLNSLLRLENGSKCYLQKQAHYPIWIDPLETLDPQHRVELGLIGKLEVDGIISVQIFPTSPNM